MNGNIDWQRWQYFVAIAEQGSLSRASSVLDVSQPTLSRQLLSLEKNLGQSLFNRTTQGLTLTEFGAGLLEESHRMQRSADRLNRLAQGQSHDYRGRVRLSANQMIAQYYLPRLLPAFMERYPDIFLEIEVDNRASNLDKRDADVAIRMFPPTQLDLVARHLFDIPLGFFAHSSYIEKQGLPRSPADLFSRNRVLGYDRDTQFEEGARALNFSIRNEDFKFRTDFMPLHLETAMQGGGIVATHAALCRRLGLVELDVGIAVPDLPVYLACHRDVQHNNRIRALMDYLAQTLPTAVA